MEQHSVKNEFEDMVEEKPIIIVPDSLLSEHHAFISNIKPNETVNFTNFEQNRTIHDAEIPRATNTADNIKRWTVSSSVIVPVENQEDSFNIEPSDMSTSGMLLLDSVKKENTDSCGAQLCEENEQFANHSFEDSKQHTFSMSTCIDGSNEHSQKLAHALYRDVNAIDEMTKKSEAKSFCGEGLDHTVTLSSSSQSPRNERSEFSNVIPQSDTSSGEKPFKCHICGNSFITARNLSVHNRTHTGEKPYKCDVCDKTFSQNSTLTRHKLVHSSERPYKCGFCDKSYITLDHLSTHQRSHAKERPYKCDVCYEEFSYLGSLRAHYLIHTDVKVYKCDVCDKHFRFPSGLRTHQRIHTGEKPCKCDVCNKEFRTLSSLSAHRLTHTGEKPYQCDVCNKAFGEKCSLTRHQRIHTA